MIIYTIYYIEIQNKKYQVAHLRLAMLLYHYLTILFKLFLDFKIGKKKRRNLTLLDRERLKDLSQYASF